MDVSGALILADLLAEKVRRHPDRTCVVFEDARGGVRALGYAELSALVDRLCNALLAEGVQPGDKVAIMMGNCVEFLVAWLAVNQAGAVMVSVNVAYTADELRYLLIHSDSVAIILEQRFIPLFDAVAGDCAGVRLRLGARADTAPAGFRLFDDVLRESSAGHRIVRVPPDSPAQIVYTSGTTSRPKGVMISHRSSLIQGAAVSLTLGMRADERTCVVLPLFHVNAQYVGVMPTLTAGGTIVLLESYSATRFWGQVRSHRCTLMSIVPMQLRTLLAQPARPDDADHRLRFAFYALNTTDEEWTAFETRFGVKLVEGYGLSETLGICTCNPVMHGEIRRHSVGRPVLGRELRVLGEDGRERPPGEVGRIAVRGEAMFSGYYKNPEATAACLQDGWLDTGDNGYFDEQGYLYFFDRTKDIIKRSGENIAASEVERVLNEHPEVVESAVIAVPDALRDEAVKAFIVLGPGATLTEVGAREWCAARLASFKVPSFCEFVPRLPKTSIGKIKKYLLKQGKFDDVEEARDP